MRNLILFLTRFHVFFLFIGLEVICLYMIVSNHHFQRDRFMSSAGFLSAGVFDAQSNVTGYFGLKKKNAELAEQNANLLRILNSQPDAPITVPFDVKKVETSEEDSTLNEVKYEFLSAKIINKSTKKLHNFLTIKLGANQGVEPEMGVIGANGIVGIVDNVSNNYSTVMTLLHKQSFISAKIKKNNYFGSLSWDGESEFFAQLNDIPNNVSVLKGDSIVTSGFSAFFPENIPVGIVSEVEEMPGSNFHLIKVKLAAVFRSLDYVYVIDFKDREEIKKLEEVTEQK